MIDAREQVKDALLAVCSNVKMSKPSGDVQLPLICYACMGDDVVDIGHERLRWRVVVYSNTFEEAIRMSKQVEAVMHDQLGYTRRSITPDDQSKVGTDLYMRRIDYSALVNLEVMGVIKGSV